MDRRYLLLAALLASADVSAAKLNKCVDESGHVTFTQAACPGGLAGESITVQRGGAGMSLGPVGRPPAVEEQMDGQSTEKAAASVGVVGGESACQGRSDQETRTAIVRRQIFVGMTAKQATQSWGAPGEINRSSRGSDQWVYYRGDGGMQFIYVDGNGCVTDWN